MNKKMIIGVVAALVIIGWVLGRNDDSDNTNETANTESNEVLTSESKSTQAPQSPQEQQDEKYESLFERVAVSPPTLGESEDDYIKIFGDDYEKASDVFIYDNYTFSFHPNRKNKVFEVRIENDIDGNSNFKDGLTKEESIQIAQKYLPSDSELIGEVTHGKSRLSDDEQEKNLFMLYKSESIKSISEGLRYMEVGQSQDGKIKITISYNDKKVKGIGVSVEDWNDALLEE